MTNRIQENRRRYKQIAAPLVPITDNDFSSRACIDTWAEKVGSLADALMREDTRRGAKASPIQESLNLPADTVRHLHSKGITHIHALCEMTQVQIANLPGIESKHEALILIRQLERMGFHILLGRDGPREQGESPSRETEAA